MRLTRKQNWRDYYNPIRDLTMARLVAMEDQAERGQHADLQWCYYYMERSDVTIMSAIARRLAPFLRFSLDCHGLSGIACAYCSRLIRNQCGR